MAITKIPAAGFSDAVNFRNIIINGDMSIAQRGTSQASAGSSGGSYQTIDRFKFFNINLGAFTQSQSTDVPTGQGFAKSMKMDCTTADASPASADALFLCQFVEGQNLQYLKYGTANAESLTVSFWVKSNKTGTYCFDLRNLDNSKLISKSYTISSANTWEKKTITYAGDTASVFANDNGSSLQCNFWLGAGTDYTSGTLATSWQTYDATDRAVGQVNLADSTSNEWYVTGLQVEAGTSASDFEFLPYDVNLNRCLRYYQRFNQTENSYWIGNGFADNNTDCRMVLNYYPKRSNPSGTFSGTLFLAPSSRTTTTMYFDNARKNTALFYYNAFSASGSAGDGYAMILNTSATYLELNSEL